jgi:hypothetical protein
LPLISDRAWLNVDSAPTNSRSSACSTCGACGTRRAATCRE